MNFTTKLLLLIIAIIFIFIFTSKKTIVPIIDQFQVQGVEMKFNKRIVKCPSRDTKYLLLNGVIHPIDSEGVVDFLVGRTQQFGKEVKRYPKETIILPCFVIDSFKTGETIDINSAYSYFYLN